MMNVQRLTVIERSRHQFSKYLGIFAFLFFFPSANALALTGIRALDTPAIAVKAPNRVFLIAIANAGKRLVAVGEHGVITYSDDNGLSWVQSKVPVNVTLTAVKFINANEGWAVGHYGVILHTDNGGATWQEQLNGLEANQLTLAAAQVAVGNNDNSAGTPLALTRANHFITAGPDKPFLSIQIIDANNILVFGAYRMVMRTADGGKNWFDWSLHIQDAHSHNLYDVAEVGKDIYVVGEGGLVFRSTDDGQIFSPVTSPVNATLFLILSTGNNGILVGGVAGEAFRSMDAGTSWEPIQLGTSASLMSSLTLKSGAEVIATEVGSLYISRDHAVTFSLMPEQQSMALFDMVEASNGDVVVVGNAGVADIPSSAFNQIQAGD